MPNIGKIGYVDGSGAFERELKRIKRKFNIGEMSDRQASKVMADIFSEIDFRVVPKWRKKKFEVIPK